MNSVSLLLMGMQNPTPKIGKTGAHQQRRGGIPWAENQAERGNVQQLPKLIRKTLGIRLSPRRNYWAQNQAQQQRRRML
jgi:hypothetical protein